MQNDIMSAILGGAIKGGGAPEDTGDSGLLGSLAAYQSSPFLQGVPSQSGPIGQIAQALMPLVMAHAYTGQLEQARGAQQLEHVTKLFQLANSFTDSEIKQLELHNKQHPEEALQRILDVVKPLRDHSGNAGTSSDSGLGIPSGMKISAGPSGITTSLGEPAQHQPTELGLIGQALGSSSSPQAILDEQQRRREAVAQAGANISAAKEVSVEKQKRDLPPRMTPQDERTIESGNALLGLLGDAESVIGSIPKGMSQQEMAASSRNYQLRSNHPLAATGLMSLPGIGGMVDLSNDPGLDKYLSWVGQVQSALASFNVQGQRGGMQLINYLKDHFPNYADTPEDALRKAKVLRSNSSVIQRRIQSINDQIHGAAQAASDVGGGQAQGGWAGRSIFDSKGLEKRLWVNQETGEKLLLNPGEAPPLP